MSLSQFSLRGTAGALLLAAGATGCVDFTGPGLDTNPNVPSVGSPSLLFPGVQAFQQAMITGDITRYVGVWDQQEMGVARQWQTYAAYGQYNESLFFWDSFYVGGGLTDLRTIQAVSAAGGDKLFLGIAQAYEAMVMDVVASAWGDVPYKGSPGRQLQAANPNVSHPRLERQDSVYADLQIMLDSAIMNVSAAGAGPGPGVKDLVYKGSVSKWIQAAHSLKARIAIHQRDYVTAAAEAALGISAQANDYLAYASATVGEESSNFQFILNRGDDILAGDTLVSIMNVRTDPRLAAYFSKNAAGNYQGAKPGPATTPDSGSGLSKVRSDATWQQPMISYDETQLILAEARQRNGSDATALAALQAYKTTNGIAFNFAAPSTGAALLTEILTEKYIATFQSIEAWNDYKRTCFPNLRANPQAGITQPKIPLRFYYPLSERQTNPSVTAGDGFIPSPSVQQAQPRNYVDRPAAPVPPNGGVCQAQP